MIRVFTKHWDSEPFGLHQVYYCAPDRVRCLFWTYHPSFGWCDPETGDWDGTTVATALREAISRGAGRKVEMKELTELAEAHGIELGEFLQKLASEEIYDIDD